MANGDSVANDECLVRALLPALYDAGKRKAISAAFMNDQRISVSRTAVLGLEDIASIFAAQFPGAPPAAAYLVDASRVREAIAGSKEVALDVEIVEDRIKDEADQIDNPAHALVLPYSKAVPASDDKPEIPRAPRALPRGVAKAILRLGETWDIAVHPPSKIVNDDV